MVTVIFGIWDTPWVLHRLKSELITVISISSRTFVRLDLSFDFNKSLVHSKMNGRHMTYAKNKMDTMYIATGYSLCKLVSGFRITSYKMLEIPSGTQKQMNIIELQYRKRTRCTFRRILSEWMTFRGELFKRLIRAWFNKRCKFCKINLWHLPNCIYFRKFVRNFSQNCNFLRLTQLENNENLTLIHICSRIK